MSTVAQLDSDVVRLEAGERISVPLEVRNTGDTVEDYHLAVIGVPAAWTSIDVPDFTLYPGNSATATLEFHPPRTSEVPAGELRFGVHVVPVDHPDDAVVPEAVLVLLPFLDTTAELVPRTSQGAFGAKHQLAVDNRGNVPVTSTLTLADDAAALRLSASVESLSVAPGTVKFVDVRVRPVRRLWRGNPLTIPFAVTVLPADSTAVVLPGTFVQRPVFPSWLLKALLALLLLLLLLAALWFWLLRPTIQTAAKEAVAAPVAQAQEQANVAKQQAGSAQNAAEGAGSAAQSAEKSAAAAQDAAKGTPPPKTTQANFSGRLTVKQSAGPAHEQSYVVEDKNSFNLTDLVLENTQGDSGLLTVQIDNRVVLTQALESFRTTDYHFVTPLTAGPKAKITLVVQCNLPGTPPNTTPQPTQCSNATTFGGVMFTTTG